MKRLFVAVPVSKEIKEKVRILLDSLNEVDADLNLVSLENLHFTLKFLGGVEESKINEVKDKLNSIVKNTKKIRIGVGQVGVFPSLDRINVIWVGCSGTKFVSLATKINSALNFVREDDHDEVIPHLTIARVKSRKGKEELQKFVNIHKNEELGSMIVDKIILYSSELTPEGPVYSVGGEFFL